MLSIKERQKRLKYINMYNGKIDGIEGPATRKGYKTLQNKYFTRKVDKDGIYGKNTEILLINAFRVKQLCKNFKLEEFKCECGGKWCTGYPTYLDRNLLKYLQNARNKFGATSITSGLRCVNFNASIGGIRGSKHTQGKALDIWNNYSSKSFNNRKKIVDWFMTGFYSKYAYCNGYARYKYRKEYPYAPNMGQAVHINV